MFVLRTLKTLGCPLLHNSRYLIISSLFRKRNQPSPGEPSSTKEETSKEAPRQSQQQKEAEDGPYNFFERRKEIDTSFDFSKLREMHSDSIPEDVGKGGLEEVMYWSQNAKTPEQITHVLVAFNRCATSSPEQVDSIRDQAVYLQDFASRVTGNVYLVNSLQLLREYAMFAYTFSLSEADFWEKLQFKTIKLSPSSPEEASFLIDIGFAMGQFEAGSLIYNHLSKMLSDQKLSIDQYVKLYLTYYLLKKGEKEWIDILMNGISQNLHEANAEQFTAILPALKEAKKLPNSMNQNIEKRALQLIDNLEVEQVFTLVNYFGFEHKNESLWRVCEARLVKLLSDMPIDAPLAAEMIQKLLTSYQMPTDFIVTYLVAPIERSKMAMLSQFSLSILSSLSKGLYIYELEGKTKHLEVEISKLVISKMTKDINELSDSEIVKVIQDYNLTRNGSRELYIFLEEVVKLRYLQGFDPEMDRLTIELLIEIYGSSGMCTRQMYDGLQSLLLD